MGGREYAGGKTNLLRRGEVGWGGMIIGMMFGSLSEFLSQLLYRGKFSMGTKFHNFCGLPTSAKK